MKLELKSLEILIAALQDEKSEIEKLLYRYHVRFNLELAPLVREILYLKSEKLREEALADESKRKAYEEATSDSEKFEQDYEASKSNQTYDVTEEEKQELRAKFRAASKLCHPDVVAEEYKKDAASVFTRLNDAYKSNDLKAVSDI